MAKKKLEVIEVSPSGIMGYNKGAWVFFFMYTKYKGNFIVSGFHGEVEEFIKKNYTHYFYNWVGFYNGHKRNVWHFWKDSIGIFEPSKGMKRIRGRSKWQSKYVVRYYGGWGEDLTKEQKKFRMEFKRMPHRWIPELDKI